MGQSENTSGIHTIKQRKITQLTLKSIGQYSLLPFQFEATWNDPKKNFLAVTPNGKYFQTADGEVFFPVGQNLHSTSYDCDNLTTMPNSKFDNPDCETCYDYGSDDPCCGLDQFNSQPSFEWRYGLYRGTNSKMQLKTEPIAAYQKNLKRLEDIKAAGANTVRMHMWPIAYEFEFEKLNNYYDRLFMASELDWYFDRAHELNMRVDFCMQFHMYYIQHGGANLWDFTDIPRNTGDTPEGYCYHTQSDLTGCTDEPYSFFEKENARKYFKKKLRYLIARYGYSSAMMSMEFWSEQNNLGTKNDYKENTPDAEQINLYQVLDNTVVGNYDGTNFQIRGFVADWNAEMVDYIKDELKHHTHPIGAHYAGKPMWTYGQNCSSEYFDYSWIYPSFDFIGYSSYDQATDRYAKWTSSDWEKFGCSWSFLNYQLIGKPVFHLEQGPGGVFNDEDYTFFEKDLWCNGFSGFASSGFPWGRRNYEPSWNMFGNVRQFFETEVFPMGGFTEGVHWYPGRSLSNESNTKRLEAVYLRYRDDGNQKAVGIIMNRLWNPATTISISDTLIWNGDPTVKDTPLYQWNKLLDAYGVQAAEEGNNYTIFQSIDYGNSNEPRIDEMGQLESYTIKYYNPYTLQVIHTSGDDTGLEGHLRLKEVPELSFSLPYVLFKVENNGGSISNLTIIPNNAEHSNFRTTDTNNGSLVSIDEDNQTNPDGCDCQFYPNPVKDFLQLDCSMDNYLIEIFNAEGRGLFSIKNRNKLIQFENFPAGVYTIKLTTEKCVLIRRIIKI
jgi:Secretion system C-terminal sorting domain